jgi:U3 small nucleolar RNA-associated protein 11
MLLNTSFSSLLLPFDQDLLRKAEERNPDEFYFAMEKARTKDGVHVVPTAELNKYSQEELRLMKTQDVNYISLKAQAESKKVEKLQASLHLIGAPAQNKHVIFVENKHEAAEFDPAEHFDTPAELLDRTFNRPRRGQLENLTTATTAGLSIGRVAARIEKKRSSAYKELLQRKERQEKLGRVAHEMAYKKETMGKGRKRKLGVKETGGVEGVYKWKAERKK